MGSVKFLPKINRFFYEEGKKCMMSYYLLERTRLVGFVKNSRQSLRLALAAKRNDVCETKRFFVSQVNPVLFKDCDSRKDGFSQSSSCSQSKNSCEGKTSREKRSGEISSVSGTVSCDSDQRKSSVDSCQSRSSSSEDSCPRDCKLAADSFSIQTPVQKYHLELSPSPFSPPSKGTNKKENIKKLYENSRSIPKITIFFITNQKYQ